MSLHLISPMSKGLFHKAIMQSGASSTPVCCGKVTDTKQLELFAIAVNCSMQPSLTECVARVPSEDILSAQNDLSFIKYSGRQDIAVPIVDGEFLPDLPENLFRAVKFHDNVDVITGFNTNEGSLFPALMPLDLIKDGIDREVFESRVKNRIYTRDKNEFIDDLILFQYTNHSDQNNKIFRRHLMMDLEGHAIFDAPALLEAVSLAKGGQPPYVYVFDHGAIYTALPDWFTGVIHAMDLPFVFGAPFRESVAGLEPFTSKVAAKFSNIEKGMSLQVMKLWTDFAKYGSPNSPGFEVTWPKFTEEEQEYLVISLNPRVERRYKADKIAFWNEIVPKMIEFIKKKESGGAEWASKDEL